MTNRCPITYDVISSNEKYSQRGLKLLSPKLTTLHDLPFTITELRQEAIKRATKLSIQGIQQKLSAQLSIQSGEFRLVDQRGTFILKPQSLDYPQLPENEDLTMKLAKTVGIEVPLHGMVYGKDGVLTYFIKRFDRYGHNKRCAVEDFSQLSNLTRDEKYNSSMEQVQKVIEVNTTFPLLEKHKLFTRTLFNYLIGNEDMHLKNFSLVTRNNKITLSPAYDFLNSTIALPNAREEIALPIQGKKANLTYNTLIKYFGIERLGLKNNNIEAILSRFAATLPSWDELLQASFLSENLKIQYAEIISKRAKVLKI